MNNWISVKDGLPVCFEKTEDGILQSNLVLVYARMPYGGAYGTARYQIDPRDKTWDMWDGIINGYEDAWHCDITHWCELPEPPKEVDDELQKPD